MNITMDLFEMILSYVRGILDGQVCFLNLFSFFQISDTLFLSFWRRHKRRLQVLILREDQGPDTSKSF